MLRKNIFEGIKRAEIQAIRAYKNFISPLLGDSCRFYPTCSTYAEQVVEEYGVIKGTGKAFWRILRCNPFSRGGYDPVKTKEQCRGER